MALGRSFTTALEGVDARIVTVEANIGPGLPGIHVVGLGDAAVSESRDRIRTAFANSQLAWPKTKIVVSMSPASLRKAGSHFDLPTALAVLAAREPGATAKLDRTLVLGELGLDGSVREVPGVLPSLLAAAAHGCEYALIPAASQEQAMLVPGLHVLPVSSLQQAWEWALGETMLFEVSGQPTQPAPPPTADFSDIAGQSEAKLAAEVAAAGGHHLIMIGPPGSGKSMIAARLPSIMPPLTPQSCLEATVVHSVVGESGVVTRAPFIAPHHSVSRAALLGGGSGRAHPGAVSLAHHGVLFLDEVSEIPAAILDSLRTPLEDGEVRLVRSRREVTFPAQFQLVLAANPCRCAADDPTRCTCTSRQRATYLNNLSGPLRDRLDMVINLTGSGAVLTTAFGESSATIADRVAAARAKAEQRWSSHGLAASVNAHVDPHLLRRHHPATEDAMAYLGGLLAQGRISQRGVDRSLKLSWTLADLAGEDQPTLDHLGLAVTLRGGRI